MNKMEWLTRYRAQIRKRRPEMPAEHLAEIMRTDAHEALSADYPEDPEKAVDEDTDFDTPTVDAT